MRNGEWLEIRAEYRTNPTWVEELTCKFYVLMKAKSAEHAPKGSGQMALLTGEVTYTDIPKGNDHFAHIYLHPVKRFRYGDVQAYAVEFQVNGETVGGKSKEGPSELKGQKWWEGRLQPQAVLLNRAQTPFSFLDFTSQDIIKPMGAR